MARSFFIHSIKVALVDGSKLVAKFFPTAKESRSPTWFRFFNASAALFHDILNQHGEKISTYILYFFKEISRMMVLSLLALHRGIDT